MADHGISVIDGRGPFSTYSLSTTHPQQPVCCPFLEAALPLIVSSHGLKMFCERFEVETSASEATSP